MTATCTEEARENTIRNIAADLSSFDFEAVDKYTGNHFLQWFYDRIADSDYFVEFCDLAARHQSWAKLHALELATGYVDYLEAIE